VSFRDVFSSHVYLTTSGNFSNPALLCCVQELRHRPDHVRGRLAVRGESIGHQMGGHDPPVREDKIKILSGNAKRLLHM